MASDEEDACKETSNVRAPELVTFHPGREGRRFQGNALQEKKEEACQDAMETDEPALAS